MDWLKGIKDFHGSVEKSSLARAQDINCQGTYTIGQEQDKITTPDNALKLDIETNKVEGILLLMFFLLYAEVCLLLTLLL